MQPLSTKFLRYIITGGTAAVADVAGFQALLQAGLHPGLAAILSWNLATVANYLLTSGFVFSKPATWLGYARFLSAAFFGFLINISITLAGMHMLALPPLLAKIIGIGIAFFVNFVLNVVLVFSRGSVAKML